MLDFIKKSCFNKTNQYKKLFIMLLVDSWVEKLAASLGGVAFFLLLTVKDVPSSAFYILTFLFVLQFVLMFLIRTKLYIFNFKTVSESIRDFQIVLGAKLRRLPMGFYDNKRSADLLKVLVDDHNMVNMTWTGIIQVVAAFTINLLVLVIVLPLLDLKLAALLIALIPISYLFVHISQKKYRQLKKEMRDTTTDTSSHLLDYISDLATLRLFNMKGEEFSKLTASLQKIKKLALKVELSSFPIATFSTSLLFMGSGLIAYFGALLIEQYSLNPVIYIVFLFVSLQVYNPLVIVYLNVLMLSDFKAAVKRIYQFYDYEELKSGDDVVDTGQTLAIRQLDFAYGSQPILKQLNLTIESNKIYAIVGKSGCGKTTLLKMLLRYYEPSEKSIFIGQTAIDNFEIEKYLSLYGVVFQNAYMFNKSIAYNIGIAKNNATIAEITAAAKLANCHEFIEKLADGYNTIIGVNGSKLSAGQRQRIAVARAFLKDASVILMDEPTASLDIENEMLLKLALQKLAKQKTVMVISHRLHFVKDADHIIVMDDGQIDGIGNHDSLIDSNAIYQNLWRDERQVMSWNL